VIAAPHGYVLGLAVGIVLESDLIVAEAGTKFQITETPRGLGGAKYWGMLHFRGYALCDQGAHRSRGEPGPAILRPRGVVRAVFSGGEVGGRNFREQTLCREQGLCAAYAPRMRRHTLAAMSRPA
jgi:hypothetical protein